MKNIKYFTALGLLVAGVCTQSSAQQPLPEVYVYAKSYKYLSAVDNKELAQPIQLLERKAAVYDVRNTDYYDVAYDNYFVSFYLPQGYVLAEYDGNGKIIRTAEKFNNISLPQALKEAIATKYPDWVLTGDTYKVSYNDANGAKKAYNLVLEKGDKRMRIVMNDKGEFLN
jgi:hypothetical protein